MIKSMLAASIPLAIVSSSIAAETPPFQTEAPVAFLKDLSSGSVLYAKNADRKMPPASLAKMMTVFVAFDLMSQGQLNPHQTFQMKPETYRKWHGQGSTMFISSGERVSVENLLYGIITLSGNDACIVLAEGIAGTEQAFVEQMNAEARRLGLKNSHFGTANGWPDEGRTYVTARDLASLAGATIERFPRLYAQYYAKPHFTWGHTVGGNAITQANRDPILGRVDGADGLKTGHTEEAGFGFTGSAEQNGRRLVEVVAGLTSSRGRVSESVRLMDWGFRAWHSERLFKAHQHVGDATVQLGAAGEVALEAPRDLAVSLPAGIDEHMKVKVVYDGPVKAPIRKGQHIANLVVTTDSLPPKIMPLVAAHDVHSANILQRIENGARSLF